MDAAEADNLPLAETLDEATLRRVFPGAPADVQVPRDARSMFMGRMRSAGGAQRQVWIGMWSLLIVAGVALLVFGQAPAGGVTIIVAVIVALGIMLWQNSKARDQYFERYATARGLQQVENSRISSSVPLFDQGDKRKWPRVLTGMIAGREAQLGHYTYTEISTDNEGNRNETDYDFTVVCFELPPEVAARFVGVYVAPKGLFSFGSGVADKLTHDRKVELESAEFAKRYSLRVVDEQDDIALYELFSTTFVDQLATSMKVFWQQRGSDLVIWHKGHESETADLDRICLEAWHVLQRYLDEYR